MTNHARAPTKKKSINSSCRASKRPAAGIPGVGRAGINGLDDDEGVQKVAGYHVGTEGRRLLLEDDGDDVVADVTLALQLLRVARAVGQHRGHVEEDLPAAEHLVDRCVARLAVPRVQATSVTEFFFFKN